VGGQADVGLAGGDHALVLVGVITAAAGFLLSVLWFDLMFDVQVARHRAGDVPEPVLASIAAYYRRVTTTASPMGRLVAVVMLVLTGGIIWQAADGDAAVWVSIVSFVAAGTGIGLALVRTFGHARRLGARGDPIEVQSALARSILGDHVVCFAAMVTVLVAQLGGAA